MRQYIGVAYAQFSWLAWREGNLAEVKIQAEKAIKLWHTTIQQLEYPLFWLALFPLMGVALQEAEVNHAVEYAKHLLIPPQQRLPNHLTELLERAVAAWETSHALEAESLLRRALQSAHAYHYV